jgi:hypothetical protein
MIDWNRYIVLLREHIQSMFSNKKKLMVICGSAIVFLLLLLLLVISIRMNHNQDEMQKTFQGENRLLAPEAIKQEELFLPSEPDFLPDVILDREPRSFWTDEDADQFWNDPLDGNTEVWKNRIIESVDELLENIP